MLGKNSRQIDVFNNMIFQSLVPKDHLLVKIDSIIDFSFVYDKVKDKYSPLGRSSKDPLMMLKILLLEYLYNLIIVDEDSEIILASVQTPFNVGDEKKLIELIEKTEKNFGLKPEEISADKVYGITDNRAYLKDNKIVSNIAFYEESQKQSRFYEIKEFKIPEDMSSATCPNGVTTKDYIMTVDKASGAKYKVFKFDNRICKSCPLRDKCIYKDKNGKPQGGGRRLKTLVRYDAVLSDKKHIESEEFQEASNKRFKIERRFATMVRNHGLRRSRYLGLKRSSVHIILANMACNIIRMVNILCQPRIYITQN